MTQYSAVNNFTFFSQKWYISHHFDLKIQLLNIKNQVHIDKTRITNLQYFDFQFPVLSGNYITIKYFFRKPYFI